MMEKENEKSFEELYKETLKETKLGKTVTGKIISITKKGEIFVDIGYKADGIIPKQEYAFNENANPADEFKIGDTITADVVKQNDGLGNVLLSYKRVKVREAKKEIEKKIKENAIFEEPVAEVNDKGLVVKVNDMRIFIPMSLSAIMRGEEVKDYLGKIVRFRITEYEPKTKRIIGSIRNVVEEEKQARLKEFWDHVEIGKKYTGIVASLSAYGAFVDIGGVQGLLHVSEISWVRNIKPEEILKQGQEIEVTVIDLDKENRRIKFSYGDKGPNPWNHVEEKYHIGDVVKVKIVKMMPFGVFVELEPGVEGLIHISQICERKITKPEDELILEKHVNAKIIDLDKENQRIELSMKEIEGTSQEYREE
ncbi:MAG: 30S ribosomal protein S1 [Clostridia bacterium]